MSMTARITGRTPDGTTQHAVIRWNPAPLHCPNCHQPVVWPGGRDQSAAPCQIRPDSWGDLEPIQIQCGSCGFDLTPTWTVVSEGWGE